MSPVNLDRAIRLSAAEVRALIQGRMIAVMTWRSFNPGEQFALYPADTSINLLPPERYYRSSFLPLAKTSFSQLNSETVLIKAWARCELCQILNDPKSLEALSQLTVWKTEGLQQTLLQRRYIFLTLLRVYLLPQPLEIPVHPSGNFVTLPSAITVNDLTPVLSDTIFAKRRQQLEKLEPPKHPELEELQSSIALLSTTNPNAKQLDAELKVFLGWSETSLTTQPDPDLDWIKTIAQIGNSSDGNTFEKLVRKSFLKLGFGNSNSKPKASLDPEATGGAGGLDFYCESPYQVVGECKASKHESVPNSVTAQLVHLGLTHLGKDLFDRAIKFILAAGPLTNPANQAAIGSKMNVIRPETLQRLVELKAQHPGSINLLDLKPCLEQDPFGEDADVKVNRYIEQVLEKIKLRSHLIELVKDYLEKTRTESVGFSELYAIYAYKNPPQPFLSPEELHEVTVELSSPLTGFLGRNKGSDAQSDRFYFLRDLRWDN
jgi:hypothetical protein